MLPSLVADAPKLGSGRFQVRAGARLAIRIARKAQQLSQAELGVMMGYAIQPGQRAVSDLEAGKGGVEQYMNAAAALGVPLDDVIEYVRVEPGA